MIDEFCLIHRRDFLFHIILYLIMHHFYAIIYNQINVSISSKTGLRKKTVRGAPPQADESNVVSRVNNELFGALEFLQRI